MLGTSRLTSSVLAQPQTDLKESRLLFLQIRGLPGAFTSYLSMYAYISPWTSRSQDYGAPDGVAGGKVALSADGDTVLWKTSSNGIMVSQYTNPFTAVSSLPSTAVIASDKRNNSVFYAADSSKFYLSTDGGKTFAATKGSLGSSTSPVRVTVHPSLSGDVWVSTDKGIFHTTDSGATFSAISGVSQAWALALGAPATTGGYPALFAAANIGGTVGYFRTDDKGANWVQINDAAHGFGSASANCMAADLRVYGRVYIGTNGRGIFYGDAAGAAPPPTTTVATTTTTAKTTTTAPTTTISTTTAVTTSATTTAPASGQTAGVYGQCGGLSWTGPTACACASFLARQRERNILNLISFTAGSTCVKQNDYYSQCLPS